MDGIFGESAAVVAAPEVSKDTTKERKVQELRESLRETISTDPDFSAKLRKYSKFIEVVNTLGYGKGGNIIVDKTNTNGDRRLVQTSQIVGYKLRNNSEDVIEYTTEVFQQDETGKFVGQKVRKQWAPGEEICLTRQFTTVLCAIPEISFTLANGKIVASSKSKKKQRTLAEELSAHYFSFNKSEDGSTPQVNDDEVKLSIDDAAGKIKPEYVETFGYLNNPKEAKAARQKGAKYTTQDMLANYINKLVEGQGI